MSYSTQQQRSPEQRNATPRKPGAQHFGLASLRVRGIERVRLHADLTMLGRLALALAKRRERFRFPLNRNTLGACSLASGCSAGGVG